MADQKSSSHSYPMSSLGCSPPGGSEIHPLMMDPPFPDDEPPPYAPYISAEPPGIRSPAHQQAASTDDASSNLLIDHDVTDARNLTSEAEQEAKSERSRRAKQARALAESRNVARAEQAAAISSAEVPRTTYKRRGCFEGNRKWAWMGLALFTSLFLMGAFVGAHFAGKEVDPPSNSTSNATGTSSDGTGSATFAMPVRLSANTDT